MTDNITPLPVDQPKSPRERSPLPSQIVEDETVRRFRPALTGQDLDTPWKREAAFLTPGHPFRDQVIGVVKAAMDEILRTQELYKAIPAGKEWFGYIFLAQQALAEQQVADYELAYRRLIGDRSREHSEALRKANDKARRALSRLFDLPVSTMGQVKEKRRLGRKWHHNEQCWQAPWKMALARDLERVAQRRAERDAARNAREG